MLLQLQSTPTDRSRVLIESKAGRKVRQLRHAWDALLFTADDRTARDSNTLSLETASVIYDIRAAREPSRAQRLQACVSALTDGRTTSSASILRLLLLLRSCTPAADMAHPQRDDFLGNRLRRESEELAKVRPAALGRCLGVVPPPRHPTVSPPHPEAALVMFALLGVPIDVRTLDRSVRTCFPPLLRAGAQFQSLRSLVDTASVAAATLIEDPLQGFIQRLRDILHKLMHAVMHMCEHRTAGAASTSPTSLVALLSAVQPVVRRVNALMRTCTNVLLDGRTTSDAGGVDSTAASDGRVEMVTWTHFPSSAPLVARLYDHARSVWASCSTETSQVCDQPR